MAAVFGEYSWQEAFYSVEALFEIESLFPEQKEAIKAFIEKDVSIFVSLPTGAGKSMIFQSLPFVFDSLYGNPRATSVLMVISPLKALMKDQVNYLLDRGIPAVAIVDELSADPEIIQQVKNGTYTLVYGSPECFLSSKTWRDIFSDTDFTSKLIGVAIDEAHCIVHWGLSGNKKVPFRKWFGCLGEIRSLIPKNNKIIIVTATATKATKSQILESLDITADQLHTVEQNPNRINLMYILSYMDKQRSLKDVFIKLITELRTVLCKTERTLIYCQTRKQCSLLFRMFEINLGKNMYNGAALPPNRLVEMFHAGTPQSVKDHVIKNMTATESHLRVLIATVAFGMG
ncbi:mediator of RNA polymerase II transcription subunit 34-like [Paramuricea clavata]|uniref:DNA 3'-5' helicase n=1 Tax=Paramuricea clavata TaxID=317549 RepID=A0A6S7GHX3_PARCT|nr:mediator of RNA polymerase II transcription subunit 34-like [Paramuricea clavata]